MASCTKHLRSLLCEDTPFVWTDAHEAEFTDLKDALLSPDTMLYHPDWNSPFELHTDASKHGIGAMLASGIMVNCVLLNFFHVLLQQWKVTGQPPTKNFLLSSICLNISDPICLDANSPSSQIMRISSGLPVFPQQSKLVHWCLSMAEFDFKIEHRAGSANVILDVLSHAPLTHPSTTGDDLFLPPQPVTCFLTSLIGFDIPYLDPSHVSEIFSDVLTCLTFACNPLPLQCLKTCPKSHPSRSQSEPSPPPARPLDKDPLITPSLPAEPNPQAPNCADPQALYPLNFSRLSFANKQ